MRLNVFSRNSRYIHKLKELSHAWIISFCLLMLFLAHTIEKVEEQSLFIDHADKNQCGQKFSIQGFSSVHADDSIILYQVQADSLIQSPRKGQKFLFKNYYELNLQNMVLDQPIHGPSLQLDFESFKKTTGISKERIKSNKNLEGCWLNRILIDDIQINFKPVNGQVITLSASHARMTSDATNLKFERNVIFKSSKCTISAALAIWSNNHNGLFFPEAYQLNDHHHGSGDFYRFLHDGSCQLHEISSPVEYNDILDDVEVELFNHVFQKTIWF